MLELCFGALLVEQAFADFVVELTDKVDAHGIQNLVVRTVYRDNKDRIFRGDINFNGSTWRDWVMIDWGDDGVLPNKIWGFVDLRQLNPENDIHCGGLYRIEPGLYAIVESGEVIRSRKRPNRSEIFVHVSKTVASTTGNRVQGLKFYLADVGAFDESLVVVPDLGGRCNSYLLLRGRDKWAEDFGRWIGRDYEKFPDFTESNETNYEEESEEEEEECEEESA